MTLNPGNVVVQQIRTPRMPASLVKGPGLIVQAMIVDKQNAFDFKCVLLFNNHCLSLQLNKQCCEKMQG